MKKLLFCLTVVAMSTTVAYCGNPQLEMINGHNLTLINKLMDTPDRYARVDTLKYDGFTDFQRRNLNQMSAGLALVFETNSNYIYGQIDFKNQGKPLNAPAMSAAGLDLYIKNEEGQWIYAGNNTPKGKSDAVFELVSNLAPGNKECLVYLPMYSIVDSVKIGVAPGSYVKPIDNPFRHRIVFWGSSFTHGVSTSRAGMAYPLQFERATGLHTLTLGVSGNSKLQQSYARVLADTDADAFVFDAFSNPSDKEIVENFEPFMATLRAKHPDTPVIFMQTIYREHRNFDTKYNEREQVKMETARREVTEAMKTDPNLYFIDTNAGDNHETTCDGTHPSDFGYYLWMMSIKDPILEILSKYGL